jgi:hypothetical protein
VSSPYSSPTSLQVISPPPIKVLNTDIDECNIVHFSRTWNPTKRALETIGTAVQSKAKKPKSKQVSSCCVYLPLLSCLFLSLIDLGLWFRVHVDHQVNYLHTCIFQYMADLN